MELFEHRWKQIQRNSGKPFHTITGLEFTYSIEGDYLIPSRTYYKISKKDFEKVFDMGPLKGPGEISNDVRGSAYVWAIMHDKRIRK